MIIDRRQAVPVGNSYGIRLQNMTHEASATVKSNHQIIRIIFAENMGDGIEVTLSHKEAIELCALILRQVANAQES